MADAKVSNIGLNSAVAAEKAATPAVEASAPAEEAAAPNVSERRVKGTVEYPAPNGSKIVVTHL